MFKNTFWACVWSCSTAVYILFACRKKIFVLDSTAITHLKLYSGFALKMKVFFDLHADKIRISLLAVFADICRERCHLAMADCRRSTNKFGFAPGLFVPLTVVLGTFARRSTNKFGFALGLFVPLTVVLGTFARQSTNKFGFALDLFVPLCHHKLRIYELHI